jgi:hypothetical protein
MLVWTLLLFYISEEICVLKVLMKPLRNITPTGRASVNFSRSDDQMFCPFISVAGVVSFVSTHHCSSLLVA